MTSGIEEELARRGRVICPNRGRSMLPLLRENRDLLAIERRGPERLRRCDAILFRRGERYVLHRILRVRKADYFVAGDNDRRGEIVRDEQILGRLTQVIRDGKTLSVEDPGYRFQVRLWCDLYPLRVLIFGLRDGWRALGRRTWKRRKQRKA